MINDIRAVLAVNDSKEFRKFGLTIGVFLILLGLIFIRYSPEYYQSVLYTGIGFLCFGLILPSILRPFFVVWMTIAALLGYIMTRIILSIIYFLIFTPVSIFFRITGKKLLESNINPEVTSYWKVRPSIPYSRDSSEKQY